MDHTQRASDLRHRLRTHRLVADGAMATVLYDRGVFVNRCFDELNLSSPDLVRQVHEDYAAAGAEILEANTFGANRARLAAFGLSDRLAAINAAGVRVARAAASNGQLVAGAIGPLGIPVEPLGPTSRLEARAIFREQAETLLDAGVDLLVLETFGSLDELREAVAGVREAGGTAPVIVAQVTVDDQGLLPSGVAVDVFTPEIDSWPVDVIGINCSVGPKGALDVVERMARLSSKPLSAMPNAGMPTRVEGRNIYLCSPEYMAQYARRLIAAGATIVGGCCGTTPGHIRQIAAETRSLQPQQSRVVVAGRTEPSRETALPPARVRDKSALGRRLEDGEFVTLVEILPPRGVDATREVAGARLCAEHGIDAINVPDGPRASARMSSQVTCQLIQQGAGIEAVNHFCCRDRNILGIQSELLGIHSAGVRNLICITGDPPRMGTYPGATAVFDVDSIGLVNIVANLNRGLDIGGNPIGSQTALLIGVGANPGAPNLDEEIRRFNWKVEAGAEFVVTQPVFDTALLERFLRRIEPLKIPVLCGIWPLTSFRNAEFMANELRVPVPPGYMRRMRQADSGERARQEGVAIAREMAAAVQPMVQGVQLSAPFGRYDLAIEVASAIDRPARAVAAR